ncbi:MAG: amidotransferase [Pseudomonadales bacterium]
MKSSESTLRVGILRTDQVLPQFQSDFGDYPDMFRRLLETAAEACLPTRSLSLHDYDARQRQFPAADACSGYVITGSRHGVYDDEPWIEPLVAFLREVIAAERKIVGICFGHQLVAHFFGGEARPADAGWGVGVQESRLVAQQPWMIPHQDRLKLLSSHKDQVSVLPEGARLIATSPFCPIAGFVIDDQIMTLQGHPEFVKGYSQSLMEMRREILGESTFQAGMESLLGSVDGDLVGRWMINFLSA